jgi:hypothetical protein
VTRIIWLRGLQKQDRDAFRRYIYIHGTPEERTIGRPASYGCVRMRSCDVMDLFEWVDVGTPVRIQKSRLPGEARRLAKSMEAAPPPIRRPHEFAPGADRQSLVAHQTFAPPVAR